MNLQQAIAAGRTTWAVVLRSQSLRLVPGREVREGELLCWTAEGGRHWIRVAHLTKRLINSPTNPRSK